MEECREQGKEEQFQFCKGIREAEGLERRAEEPPLEQLAPPPQTLHGQGAGQSMEHSNCKLTIQHKNIDAFFKM